MAITYTWEIGQLKCIPKVGNRVNVVTAIPYNYIGIDDSDNTKSTLSGIVEIQTSDLSDWTAYANLTKSKVEGWLEANLPISDLKAKIDADIVKTQNPPTVMVGVPW